MEHTINKYLLNVIKKPHTLQTYFQWYHLHIVSKHFLFHSREVQRKGHIIMKLYVHKVAAQQEELKDEEKNDVQH